MQYQSQSDKIRRASARRFARNLAAMVDASDAEYRQTGDFVAEALSRFMVVVVILILGAIQSSGWPVWAQAVATATLVVVVVAAILVWRANTPRSVPTEPEPPFARLTPRRRSRAGRSSGH